MSDDIEYNHVPFRKIGALEFVPRAWWDEMRDFISRRKFDRSCPEEDCDYCTGVEWAQQAAIDFMNFIETRTTPGMER